MARRADRDGPEPREKSFAELAPVYEQFPGLKTSDFAAFEKRKQRDAEFNAERLIVKRKLAALGAPIAEALAAAGLPTEARTSLSHPYTFNGFKVDSMWVYFGRGEAAKKLVKKRLGADLGKDADPTYHGVILVFEIDEKRALCGLKIHPQAWWDGQNLKNKVQRVPSAPKELTDILNALPRGYAMTLGDWKRRYEAGKLYEADIRNYFQYYNPGEQWVHVGHETPAAAAIEAGPALAARAGELIAALVPLFRFIAWSPENDHVLGARGGQ